MARLIKTRIEVEGGVYERLTVAEGQEPKAWQPDAKLRLVGKDVPRVDGPERVSGRATYTFDVQLPGMLYARVLRSPYPHARIKRLDVTQAEALPGVRAVITYQNTPRISWPSGPPVFDEVLRYAGDDVAAVAADEESIAEDAIALIDIEYEVLPFVVDAEAALRPNAPHVHRDGNLIGGKPRVYQRGDIGRGFTEADVIVEETFHTQPQVHNCLESHGAVAAWDGDKLTVWESTQHVYGVREQLAYAFDLPLNKVRTICQYMGGGFGSKQYTGKWSIQAALLAQKAGQPVHLMLTRQEENLASGYRQPTTQRLRIGARRDGTLTAIELVVIANVGAYGGGGFAIDGPAQIMYACPNVRTEVSSVFTNTGPARAFRGPGYVEGAFPLESAIDELAARLGMDPLEIRLKNFATINQSSGRRYSANHLKECYQKGVEMIGWQQSKAMNQVSATKRRAMGMASQIWGGGGGPPAYAWVKLNSDGTADVLLGTQDIGTGTKTVFAQIAAEELELELDQVTVHLGDSDAGPYAPVSWGSMTVSSVGPAVRQAAIDARNQLRDVAADLLDLPSNKVEVRNGNVYTEGETRPRMRVADVFDQVDKLTILGKGSRGPNSPDLELRTFGAQFAQVEVDTVSGEVKVLRIVTVHDFGRVMNPLGAGNLVEGAIVQGIGYGLTEARVVDQRSGIVLNPNLEDYLVPTAMDIPVIDHAFIDIPDERANNLGAKGLGEPSFIPTAPAIANAIARAIGVRFLSIPITREKILQGLKTSDNTKRTVS